MLLFILQLGEIFICNSITNLLFVFFFYRVYSVCEMYKSLASARGKIVHTLILTNKKKNPSSSFCFLFFFFCFWRRRLFTMRKNLFFKKKKKKTGYRVERPLTWWRYFSVYYETFGDRATLEFHEAALKYSRSKIFGFLVTWQFIWKVEGIISDWGNKKKKTKQRENEKK